MAVWDGGEDEPVPVTGYARPSGQGGMGRYLHRSGALVSAALVLGLLWWAYDLAERQLNGVPIIAAPEGPARVAPDNPGGELADHQGLAVNMIAAEGEAEKPADLLVLAPAPATLAPEDVASDALRISEGTALAPPAAVRGPNAGTVQPSETLLATRAATADLPLPLPEGAVDPIDAPELETVEAGSIEAALIEAGVVAPEVAAVDPSEIIPESVPGVVRSLIPPPKPESLLMQAVYKAPAPIIPAVDVDPLSLAPGTAVAHLDTYADEAAARLAWEAVAAQFGPLLSGKGRVIQPVTTGGQTQYRLRVSGFASRDEARRFCAALKVASGCIATHIR